MTRVEVPPSYRAGRALIAAAVAGAVIGGAWWFGAAGLPAHVLAWSERVATLGWFWTW